jgi:hypothetical protein
LPSSHGQRHQGSSQRRHLRLDRSIDEILREGGVDDQPAKAVPDRDQPGIAVILMAGPGCRIDSIAQCLGPRQDLADGALSNAMCGGHACPKRQILPDLPGIEGKPAPSNIDPNHLARGPVGRRPLQFHFGRLLQKTTKREDIGIGRRIVMLPAMDEDDDRQILVPNLLLDSAEERRDLIADVRSTLIIHFDKAEQERSAGIIL